MKKRRLATYLEPTTLGDLRRIVEDHSQLPDHTRIWIRNMSEPGQPVWHSIEVSHVEGGPE